MGIGPGSPFGLQDQSPLNLHRMFNSEGLTDSPQSTQTRSVQVWMQYSLRLKHMVSSAETYQLVD